jgi:hypothetical protein
MAISFQEVYDALDVSAITSLLDADTSTLSGKALYQDNKIPENSNVNNSINFYLSNPRIVNDPIADFTMTANCRAQSAATSYAIANAVIDTINRDSYSTGSYIMCNLLTTIPPRDDRDNYNTPVELIYKKRG